VGESSSIKTLRLEELRAYLWATPNSRRVSILFEELGLSYEVIPVNIRAGEQFAASMRSLNPYGKIPIVQWQEGQQVRVLFESGAILLRFADMFDTLLPRAVDDRHDALSWLMMAVSGLAPTSGQAHYWTALADAPSDAAVEHTVALAARAYGALDARLRGRDYLAGTFSIADIAAYPWIERHPWTSLPLTDYPALQEWFARVGERAAVKRGMAVPKGISLD